MDIIESRLEHEVKPVWIGYGVHMTESLNVGDIAHLTFVADR